ncbi:MULTISPECIES: DUF930 domain-containing protein [unclassified Tardiphaga]|uniref:DUF930 domain-containing protein n=1 Tax=unclassified Tardiphaga TaxID=2631404 RepID=UPI001FEFB0D1|nr:MULTISPECIES: DUF930 domain-containing protein [unclassified Tardiphaga]
MKTIACALAAATMMSAGPVHAAKAQIAQMLKLSSETRIEQRCDARAMGAVQREHKGFEPDEFVAYAFTDPILRGSKITAPGGAIRSNGKWYRLSYTCKTNADGLDVVAFAYQLGGEVPRREWDAHYLVPKSNKRARARSAWAPAP